jgi:hypothetical protein
MMATSVNDFASEFARNTPPEFVAELNEPHEEKPYQPNSPRSRYLYERGYETKAKAYDCCGSYSREWRCSEHDEDLAVETYTCHQRFCSYCASRIADTRLRKSESQIRRIKQMGAGVAQTFSLIQVRANCEAEPGALNRFWKTIFEPLKKLAKKHKGPHFLQGHMPGYDAGKLVWRAIYWGGDVSPEVLKSAIQAVIPDSEVSVLVRDNDQMHQVFARLYATLIPNDPIEQAKLEIAFDGVDQLRTSQTLTRLLPRDTNEGREESIGNNLAEERPVSTKLCSKCGKPPDCVTEWHPHNISEAERAALKRYKPSSVEPPPPRYPWR